MENIIRKISTVATISSMLVMSVNAQETRHVEKSFTVNSGASFSIENINGSIEVKKTSGDMIKVHAEITAGNESELNRVEVLADQNGNSVDVKSEYEEKNRRHDQNSASVRYTVYLPEHVDDTEIDLVNGSLVLSDVTGKLDVDLVNGSIVAENISGNSQLNSVNGSVKVSFDSLEEVDKVDVQTVNGSIKVYVPANANLNVDAETMHGSIKNDFGLTVDKNFFAGKNINDSVGSGDIRMSLESVNGSIKLLSK